MNNYRLNEIYYFSNKRNNRDKLIDAFFDGKKTIAVQGGIRVRSFTKIRNHPENIPSLIILISNNHNDKFENPWDPAYINSETGVLEYKGDSRRKTLTDQREMLDHRGNKLFKKISNLIITNRKNWIPPILYFSSVSLSNYKFLGLFTPNEVEEYYDERVSKNNLKIKCQRIKERDIPINWLRDRANCLSIKSFDYEKSPLAWINQTV